MISFSNPTLVSEVNSTGTLNVCLASLKNDVEKLVYVSSSEVYGTALKVPMDEEHPCHPTTVYGVSKLSGEYYVRLFSNEIQTVIVRPFNTYGPKSHIDGPYSSVITRFLIRSIKNLPPVIFGDGSQTRDFTYITDTVEGIVLASKSDVSVVNIACGNEISVLDVAKTILNILKKDGLGLKPIFLERRPNDVQRHKADIKKQRVSDSNQK